MTPFNLLCHGYCIFVIWAWLEDAWRSSESVTKHRSRKEWEDVKRKSLGRPLDATLELSEAWEVWIWYIQAVHIGKEYSLVPCDLLVRELTLTFPDPFKFSLSLLFPTKEMFLWTFFYRYFVRTRYFWLSQNHMDFLFVQKASKT